MQEPLTNQPTVPNPSPPPPSSQSSQPAQSPPTASSQKKDFVQMATEILDKLPPPPENWKEFFIKWYPWGLIIGGIFSLFGILGLIGFSAVSLSFLPFWGMSGSGSFARAIFQSGLGVTGGIIGFVAAFQMMKMQKSGWKLAMISEGIGIFSSLLSLSTFGIAFPFISIYFLWQVKERYT